MSRFRFVRFEDLRVGDSVRTLTPPGFPHGTLAEGVIAEFRIRKDYVAALDESGRLLARSDYILTLKEEHQ